MGFSVIVVETEGHSQRPDSLLHNCERYCGITIRVKPLFSVCIVSASLTMDSVLFTPKHLFFVKHEFLDPGKMHTSV